MHTGEKVKGCPRPLRNSHAVYLILSHDSGGLPASGFPPAQVGLPLPLGSGLGPPDACGQPTVP